AQPAAQPAAGHTLLVILGPTAWAAQTAALLQGALPGAVIRICTDTTALAPLLEGHRNAMVVVRVGADTPTAPLVAIARQAKAPGLVLAAAPDAAASVLLELISAGAVGLARDNDGAALTAALRRGASTTDAGPDAAPGAAASSALGTLADRIEQPLVLVRDGVVVHANPSFCRLLGLANTTAVRGRPLADFAAPHAARGLAALLARALLLDLEEHTRETLDFLPQTGAAFSAEVSAAPLALEGAQGLAVMVTPATAGIEAAVARATTPDHRRLLQRLTALMDDASPVERSSALALVVVGGYSERRRNLGFTGAAALLRSLADCLADAAPAQSSTFLVADDSVAVLVEDLSGAELEPLRRRLAAAPAAAAAAAVRQLVIRIGIARVAPGAGAPSSLLDAALADAESDRQTTAESVGHDTTEGLDLLAPSYSLDSHQPPSLSPTAQPACATPPPAAPSAYPASPACEPKQARSSAAGDEAGNAAGPSDLDERIREALDSQGFQLALQPIVSLMGDSREHYSVLLRLRCRDGSLASAEQILAADAARGRMADIDRWMIRSALALLRQRRRIGEKTALFISLSAEILADAQLLIWLCDALREYEIRGSWLTFQMREQDALAHSERWADLVTGLREIRCRIGLSQCERVDRLHSRAAGEPDFLQLAPSLAAGLSGDKHKQQRLLELTRLARARQARTIVTGVEDNQSLSFLWDAGVEYVQGNQLQAPASGLDLPAAPEPEGSRPDGDTHRLSLHL
ncbi:hypothetical protein CKO31_19295, partial [Thiohalocapsa halophila]